MDFAFILSLFQVVPNLFMRFSGSRSNMKYIIIVIVAHVCYFSQVKIVTIDIKEQVTTPALH